MFCFRNAIYEEHGYPQRKLKINKQKQKLIFDNHFWFFFSLAIQCIASCFQIVILLSSHSSFFLLLAHYQHAAGQIPREKKNGKERGRVGFRNLLSIFELFPLKTSDRLFLKVLFLNFSLLTTISPIKSILTYRVSDISLSRNSTKRKKKILNNFWRNELDHKSIIKNTGRWRRRDERVGRRAFVFPFLHLK